MPGAAPGGPVERQVPASKLESAWGMLGLGNDGGGCQCYRTAPSQTIRREGQRWCATL